MLAIAQRAKNKKRVRAIHAKIKITRQDLIHKFTSKLVKTNSLIVVGKVKSTSFTLSRLAKPVYGEGWFETKRQLDYKYANAEGRTNLGIRAWFFRSCKITHNREVNAAKNILAVGPGRL